MSEVRGYIRFGELPNGGHSFDHLRGHFEGGISAFRARKLGADRYVIEADSVRQVAELRGLASSGVKRTVYFLQGREVGKDSSGAPVLSEAGIVAEEVPPQADISFSGFYPFGLRAWCEQRRAAGNTPRLARIRVDRARLPDPGALVDEITRRGTGAASRLHGPMHWRRVAYLGRRLPRDLGPCRTRRY